MIVRGTIGSNESPQVIVGKLHPSVVWEDEVCGFIDCPGGELHTSPSKARDCRITIDGAPTIFCLHHSCAEAVAKANYTLRRALWEGSVDASQPRRVLSEAEKEMLRERQRVKDEAEALRQWAVDSKDRLLKRYAWQPEDAIRESPIPIKAQNSDFQFFVSLFDVNDVIWTGEPTDSGDHAREHFRKAHEWRLLGPGGHFTCPSVFDPTTCHRSNSSVIRTPYLVVESDILSRPEMCALARWMSRFMGLRAMVNTGGKSIHCWFDMPPPDLLARLKIILPALGCDPALFKPSQPVRLPGVMRSPGKMQSLIYFNPKVVDEVKTF